MPTTRNYVANGFSMVLLAPCWLLVIAATSSGAAPPVTAVLTDEGVRESGVADLLFADLATDDNLKLVERDRLNDILQELDLASAQQPGDVRGRLNLGKLLKADLLLIVRRVEKPQPHYQLVVAETTQGLRLSYDSRAASDDAAADAAALLQTAKSAVAHHDADISEVCAVPPFVSDDLGLAHAHLKAAFARVIEGALVQRPGLVFVELAEAQAVSRELALSGDEKLAHRLPLYFLGNFRHVKVAGEERIRLSLSLQRGDAVVAERKAEVSPAAAVEFLRSETISILQKLQQKDVDLIDAKTEARVLAERALAFQTTGQWSEAIALAEASLLLDPQQLEVRKNCIVAYEQRMDWAGSRRTAQGFSFALENYARALQHLEAFLREAKELTPYRRNGGSSFIIDLINWSGQLPLDFPYIEPAADRVAVEPLWRQVQQLDKQTSLRILRMRAHAGHGDEIQFFFWVLRHVPEDKRMNFVFALCTEMAELPGAQNFVEEFSKQGRNAEFLDNSQGDAYLERLEKSPHEPLRKAAVTLRDHILERRKVARFETRILPGPSEISPDQPLKIRPLEIQVQRLSGEVEPLGYFAGALQAGPEVDVFWNSEFIGLMSAPGRVRELWNRGNKEMLVHSLAFDGRYIWAGVVSPLRKDRPHLLVIDPQSGKTWPITSEAGLPIEDPKDLEPLQAQLLHVCGYGPGKACVIGSFGRSWIALVEFDPSNPEKPQIDLILEAKMAANQDQPKQWLDTSLAFYPTFMLHVAGDPAAKRDDAQRPWILIGRRCAVPETSFWPLIVDPTRRSVKVTAHRLPNALDEHAAPWVFDVDAQGVWMVGFDTGFPTDSSRRSLHLHRLQAPDFLPESMFVDPPPGRVLFHQGELLIAGKQWWSIDLNQKESTLLGDVPWHFDPRVNPPVEVVKREIVLMGPDTLRLVHLVVTHHHGPLAWTKPNDGKATLYRVEVPSPPHDEATK